MDDKFINKIKNNENGNENENENENEKYLNLIYLNKYKINVNHLKNI